MVLVSEVKTDLLVVGHINLDHEMEVASLPQEDRTVPVRRHELFLGGTAGNVVRWASSLGLKSAVAAFVGEDFPPGFLTMMKKEGVDTSRVVTRKGEMSPACWILKDPSTRQMTVIDQGAMQSTGKQRLPGLEGVGWVHVTTGDPAYQLKVTEAARKAGIHVSADPAQEIHYRWSPRDLERWLSSSEIFFGNASEIAKALSLLRFSSPKELTGLVPLVIRTSGSEGAVAYTRDGSVRCVPPKVAHPLGVTGAGDAFRGGFYRGWLRGEPLEKCLERGCRAGALVVASKRSLFLPTRSR